MKNCVGYKIWSFASSAESSGEYYPCSVMAIRKKLRHKLFAEKSQRKLQAWTYWSKLLKPFLPSPQQTIEQFTSQLSEYVFSTQETEKLRKLFNFWHLR